MSNVLVEYEEVLERIEEIEMEIAFLNSLAFLIRDKFQNDLSVNPDYIQAIDTYALNRHYKLQDELSSLKTQECILYDMMMAED